MSTIRIAATVLVAVFALGQQTAAQSLTFSLFERYLGALRDQAGIPGMAAAIVQNGSIVWERGFGLAKIDGAVPVLPSTPFVVNDLSQTVAAALVLAKCVDSGRVELDDLVQRFSNGFNDRTATFRQVLSYTSGGSTAYTPATRARFNALTSAVEECNNQPYPLTLARDVTDKFQMVNTVPGGDVGRTGSPVRQVFQTPALNRYIEILKGVAVPYRVDSTRRATPSDYTIEPLSATDGLVASVHDLAIFDTQLDAGHIASQRSLAEAWTRQGTSGLGLGWFVQRVGSHEVKWFYGQATGAYSSLIIKVPSQRMTLILLANSDGLSAPFPLAKGDVTVSPFARIFFTLLG